MTVGYAKDHTGDPVAAEIGTDFPKTVTEGPTQWHADGPGELQIADVVADDLSILRGKAEQPLANRLPATRRTKKGRRQPLQTIHNT